MDLLFLSSIEDSPEIEMYGETIVDLTLKLSNDRTKITAKDIRKTYIISGDMVAKPTILSKFIYGREDSVDLMCHINGYSNPFSINAGDKLIVPDEESAIKMFMITDNESKNKAIEAINKKTFAVDPTRKLINVGLPTNINESGKRHAENGNMLILGGASDTKVDISKYLKTVIITDIDDTLVDLASDIDFS
jgi:hypothetical protein